MKSPSRVIPIVTLLGGLVLGGCSSAPDPTKTITLPLARPMVIENIGHESDPGAESVPALDEWQAKNHADIVGLPTPVVKGGKLVAWSFRYIPSENPYLWHFAYSRIDTVFTLIDGASTEGVLNRLWAWRSASLGFIGKPVWLNFTATPLTFRTIASASVGKTGSTGGLYDDVNVELDELNVHADQETRVYGFWYLYHDPAFSVDLGELALKLPVGFTTPAAYLDHRMKLERTVAPSLRMANGRVELTNRTPDGNGNDEPVLMERFFVPSGWMDLQPYGRQPGGTVVMVKIHSVTPNTPIYMAGVKEGEILRSYQGMTLSGLTEAELNTLVKQPLAGDLHLELMDTPRSRPREVIIPLADLRQHLAKRAEK